MKVTATARGYHGKLREPGEEFDVPPGLKASWFAPLEGRATVAAKPARHARSAAKPEANASGEDGRAQDDGSENQPT